MDTNQTNSSLGEEGENVSRGHENVENNISGLSERNIPGKTVYIMPNAWVNGSTCCPVTVGDALMFEATPDSLKHNFVLIADKARTKKMKPFQVTGINAKLGGFAAYYCE